MASQDETNPEALDDLKDGVISLYRKFLWADALRRECERVYERDREFLRSGLAQKNVGSYEEMFEGDMYMCLWFSFLYVVIEGWPRLRTRFDKLTPLLRSDNKNLLKDFRDATFHPSGFWRDNGMEGLVKKGQESHDWVVAVTDAFREFFEPVAETDRELRKKKQIPL